MFLTVDDNCVDLNASKAVSGSIFLSTVRRVPVELYPKTISSSDVSVILVNFAFSNFTLSSIVSGTFNSINLFMYLTV